MQGLADTTHAALAEAFLAGGVLTPTSDNPYLPELRKAIEYLYDANLILQLPCFTNCKDHREQSVTEGRTTASLR